MTSNQWFDSCQKTSHQSKVSFLVVSHSNRWHHRICKWSPIRQTNYVQLAKKIRRKFNSEEWEGKWVLVTRLWVIHDRRESEMASKLRAFRSSLWEYRKQFHLLLTAFQHDHHSAMSCLARQWRHNVNRQSCFLKQQQVKIPNNTSMMTNIYIYI